VTGAQLLFSPLQIRGVRVPNRVVVSPMCNYSAIDGVANDWHLVTVGRYAQGGAGLVFVEATAVQAQGRITHGDTGLWDDSQIEPLARIVRFIQSQSSVAAIQLGHAGRKAGMQRPWYGNGPLAQSDIERGDLAWPIVAASATPVAQGWPVPTAMTLEQIQQLREDFKAAAKRAIKAGFQVIELHAAHGYLLNTFLSPLSNFRSDRYGGALENRMRLVCELAQDLRSVMPEQMPLFVRLSAVDDLEGGWSIDDSIQLAQRLKHLGVDVVDCSSGGIIGAATSGSAVVPRTPRTPGFQVPWAKAIRDSAKISTMGVGLILTPEQAAQVIESQSADLVAIAREALDDPNWPLHAARHLKIDPNYDRWPKQAGWWLNVRESILRKLGLERT
jgi:2,4-dienoyl-CoA reductase-like NADH-dependent reductase (Old Yellow Enzyme family)